MNSKVSTDFHTKLKDWSQKPESLDDLLTIFGPEMNLSLAKHWIQTFAKGDFSSLPPVVILTPDRMPGLWGGYSRDTNRIYLSSDCPPAHVAEVLIEEVGHFLDRELCTMETIGEEGAHFSAKVLSHKVTSAELSEWAMDESPAWIVEDNALIPVEAAKRKSTKGNSNSGSISGGGVKKQKKSINSSGGVGGKSKRKKTSKKTLADTGAGSPPSTLPAPVIPPITQESDTIITQNFSGETLNGNLNDNIFVVKFPSVFISDPSGGTDSVETDVTSFSLQNFSDIEDLVYTGISNATLSGNDLNNSLIGGEGSDIIAGLDGFDTILGGRGDNSLDGGGGDDSLIGGEGNDTYVIDSANDRILDSFGNDLVKSSIDYTLGLNLEQLELTDDAQQGTGNSLNNTIIGNSASNSLDGGAGIDLLIGGQGNDTYFVDHAEDVVAETVDQGTDLVVASVDGYTLAENVENLTLANGIVSGAGNIENNLITGNSVGNIIDGGVGIDTLIGGLGNDTYLVDNVSDIVTERSGAGTDFVLTSASGYTLANHIENLLLESGVIGGSGNSLANSLIGNSLGNSLEGGSGKDTLIGGEGNDTYFVDSDEDTIADNGGDEADLVASSVSFNLSHSLVGGGNAIENLLLIETAIHGTGNSLSNMLMGNSMGNSLDGAFGGDTLVGGLGDDTYVVDVAGDVVIETLGQGLDLVRSSISYTLGGNLEGLELTGAEAISGTGNSLDNTLVGNSVGNSLDGGEGIDTLVGGAGHDTYYVDEVEEVITEASGEGTDWVIASKSGYTLANHVENLLLVGSAISGKGNSLSNSLTGNSIGNSLDGGTGIDTMVGGAGNDTYFVDHAGDNVRENAGENADLVVSSVSGYTLAQNIENLQLMGMAVSGTGNALNNTLTGNSLGNSLDGGAGIDAMIGGEGNDTYFLDNASEVVKELSAEGTDLVVASVTGYTLAENVEKLQLAGSAVSGTGNSLNNTLTGNVTGNSLDGGSGIDSLIGGAGNDIYFVDNASDAVFENTGEGEDLVESSVSYILAANIEKLTLSGSAVSATGNILANTLTGNSAGNSLEGGSDSDSLIGGAGNDTYFVDNVGDVVFENASEGTDVVVATVSGYALASQVENLVLEGTANLAGSGNSGNNVLTGNSGNNLLTGAGGNDSFIGGEGNDTLVGGSGADSLVGGAGDDCMVGGVGADTFVGGAGNDTIEVTTGDSLNSVLVDGGADYDTLQFVSAPESNIGMTLGDNDFGDYTSIESYNFSGVNGNVEIAIGLNAQNLGIASLAGGTKNSTLTANSNYTGSVHFSGGALADSLSGNSGNDTLAGGGGNDEMVGGLGADSLDGGTGNDTMVGGIGNDTYVVDSASDVIVENAIEGTDVVRSSESYTLGSNIESLELTGTANIDGTGDSLANTITGNSGNNVLAGAGGNDTIFGAEGNDSLNGGLGNDSMIGGAGDDTYLVDSVYDTLLENANEGTDWVVASVNGYTIGAHIENLELAAGIISGKGNSLGNTLMGNISNNILDGGVGTDTMVGGQGNDTYFVDQTSDLVTEISGEGTDLVEAWVSGYTLASHVENLVLADTIVAGTGNSLNNTITGNSNGNSLNGGGGVDTMIGGQGNDTYIVDTTMDMIVEAGGDAEDLVVSSVSFNLSNALVAGGTTIKNLQLTGAAVSGIGNSLANRLTGNSLGNILTGGGGMDTMIGGQGNDTYFVDTGAEVITELTSAGTDWIVTSVTGYTLVTNVENLQLSDTVVSGTGNILANMLTGNSVGNSLNGGLGTDSLIGGAGNDTYMVDNAGDVVFENASEGEDLVESSVSYTLSANVEKLTLTGTAVSSTGNSLANTLTGNASANSLDGGSGIDSMVGGAGNDTYFVDNVGDVVFENASQGTDVVVTTVDGYTMASQIENLVIGGTGNLAGSGSAGNNLLMGNGGNNLLTGNGGNDTFNGGEGNDTLVGGSGADSLVGGAGDDCMVGGNGGNDTFAGGAGNDTIVVRPDPAFSEMVDGGADYDTLRFDSDIGMTLGDSDFGRYSNIESYDFSGVAGDVDITIGLKARNLGIATLVGGTENKSTLTADADYMGSVYFTGGVLADSLSGNSGNDTLAGGGGNDEMVGGLGADSLDGGTGNDTMVGGIGNDTYVVDSNSDVIVENASEGSDLVLASFDYTLSGNIEALELTGTSNIDGTGDALANTITGNSGNNLLTGAGGNDTMLGGAGNDSLDGGVGSDSLVGGAGDDTFVVDEAGDVVVEAAGEGTDEVRASVNFSLGSNLERLVLTGAAVSGTGNAVNNTITGNSENNSLFGEDGNDTLLGGDGNDFLAGGEDGNNDSLVGGAGNDTLWGAYDYSDTGSDFMVGGEGNDQFYFSSEDQISPLVAGGVSTVVGGAGIDSLIFTQVVSMADWQLPNVSGVEVIQASSLAGNSITLGTNALAYGVTTLKGGTAGGDTLSAAGYTASNAKITIDASGSTLGSTLIAGQGDPAFTGGNTLLGGSGADLIQVATASVLNNASIIGGTGTDTVQVTTNAQVVGDTDLDSLSGIEALQLANGANSITLGDKARGIATVTGGLDIIAMGEGSDTLTATFAFGTTAITLDGGAGDDRFVFDTATQMAAVILLGGTGTDTLALGQATVLGNDDAFQKVTGMEVLQAAAAGESSFVLDTYAQAAGIRTVIGGSGKGTLDASAYEVDVTLDASANSNTVAGQGTTLCGGLGNDAFRLLNNNVLSVSSVVGGLGSDTLTFSEDGLSITDGNFGRMAEVEALQTKNGTNYVNLGFNAATAGLKTLVGGTGADEIDATSFNGGSLTIDSGDSADFITGSSSAANRIVSGAGNDLITLADEAAITNSTVTGGTGTDTLLLSAADTLTDANLVHVSGVEILRAAVTGSSSLAVGANAQSGGIRTVIGGDANDTLNAEGFTTGMTLGGGAGDDRLVVSTGALLGQSSIAGGSGIDTLSFAVDAISVTDADFVNVSTVEVLQTANGNNRVVLGINTQVFANIEMVIGGSGNDTINASAFTATAQLTLEGGAGMDSMFGGQAADSIVGGDGHDVVIGKDGNDFLVGGEGDDHLVGSDLYNPYENTQIDTLTGGEGNDVFYFWNTMDSTLSYSKFEMNDYALITDFEIGKDLISFGGYTPEINNLLPSGITTGEAIYNGTELVAVVQLKTGTGSLSSSDFI